MWNVSWQKWFDIFVTVQFIVRLIQELWPLMVNGPLVDPLGEQDNLPNEPHLKDGLWYVQLSFLKGSYKKCFIEAANKPSQVKRYHCWTIIRLMDLGELLPNRWESKQIDWARCQLTAAEKPPTFSFNLLIMQLFSGSNVSGKLGKLEMSSSVCTGWIISNHHWSVYFLSK